MFHQHTFIPVEHHVPLESTIRNHMGITPQLAASLYRCALDSLAGSPARQPGINCSRVNDPAQQVVVGTATDEKTGVYIQLVQMATGKPRLTVGSKWAVETANPTMSTTTFMHW